MRRILFIFCLLTLILSACNNKKGGEQADGELQELKLGAMSSMDYIPFVIAQKRGIYDTLGLQLNIIKFFSANDRDAAFQSGNIDGTVIDFTGAAIQQANGIDLKMIMKNDGFFYFLAGKDSNIDSLRQLKGKNIAVSRNTVIEFSTDKVLESVNILPLEINKPEINKIPLRLEMLQSGQIQASIFPDPFATIAISNGNKPLITTNDLGFSVTGTMFTDDAIKNKKEEIKLLVKGYNLAIDYIKTHPLSEWSDLLTEDAGLPGELVDKIMLPTYQYATRPANKDIATTIQWLKDKKLIPATYNGHELIDTTFIVTAHSKPVSPTPINH